VEIRSPQDLMPISTSGIPADVRPLVEAINHHIERNRRLTEAQRQFIDDASHQLRTPLTTLTTQVGFALREADPAHLRDALLAVKLQLDETIRQTNQMLALARVDSAELMTESLELVAFVGEVTRSWWSEARTKSVDLGLEQEIGAAWVQVQAGLLREALSNLLHNAIRYTPRHGQVTVRIQIQQAQVCLTVHDNGPGIPEAERQRAGERFFRGSNITLSGSGLGLAIVRSIAERHGGSLVIQAGPGGQGLAVSIRLPLVANELQNTG
jgi:two-component system sensor histidine kinase TctE